MLYKVAIKSFSLFKKRVNNIVKLTDVIETLVEERGLSRDKVLSIVCEGILAAYKKRYPDLDIEVIYNKNLGEAETYIKKMVVASVENENSQISPRKARGLQANVALGDIILVPFEEKIGRIEVLGIAKQYIGNKIKELEQQSIADEFKDKEGTIVNGVIHKREHNGAVIKLGDVMALLPSSLSIPGEQFRAGLPIRAILKEVLAVPRGDYQVILDRSSADFVKNLLRLEIPEIFEGIVEIKKIVRIAGYKTKVLVASNSKEIDPVGTCVGVRGARIQPILHELGGEKIDLIEWSDSLERLVKNALKPAEIDKVELLDRVNEKKATVWLSEDQRSLAIGKMGKNIALAARLTGVEIKLQEVSSPVHSFPSDSSEEESGDKSE